jgi:hypothetical protein
MDDCETVLHDLCAVVSAESVLARPCVDRSDLLWGLALCQFVACSCAAVAVAVWPAS